MTDTPLPVDVAELKAGDRFTFGPPKNRECVFHDITDGRIWFRYADTSAGLFSAEVKGAKVYRV